MTIQWQFVEEEWKKTEAKKKIKCKGWTHSNDYWTRAETSKANEEYEKMWREKGKDVDKRYSSDNLWKNNEKNRSVKECKSWKEFWRFFDEVKNLKNNWKSEKMREQKDKRRMQTIS